MKMKWKVIMRMIVKSYNENEMKNYNENDSENDSNGNN